MWGSEPSHSDQQEQCAGGHGLSQERTKVGWDCPQKAPMTSLRACLGCPTASMSGRLDEKCRYNHSDTREGLGTYTGRWQGLHNEAKLVRQLTPLLLLSCLFPQSDQASRLHSANTQPGKMFSMLSHCELQRPLRDSSVTWL